MATIALSAAAKAASASFFTGGGIYASLGKFALQAGAQYAGKAIDARLGINTKVRNVEGPRLSDLSVQSSAYGNMIPQIYGGVRIAGNIIWSLPLKEVANRDSSGGGGKGGGSSSVTTNSTSYSYYCTMAIAICEGEIDEVVRVWADAEPIDPNAATGQYRLYKGDEAQLPDPVIEAEEGVGNVPAYRGMAYVVIEDFPLEDYGNRIPNFTFEVRKKTLIVDDGDIPLEEKIHSMVMIPGSGEFVYDTEVQKKVTGEEVDGSFEQGGLKDRINQNNNSGKADALVALDQLEETCPNVDWVAVVVTWFGDDMDAGACTILPGVEYKEGASTEPEVWGVAGYSRASARQITLENNSPIYGGTPDDQSLLRYLDELKSRGKSVMLYPMFFMDVENKPWRGRVTGSASDITQFFIKSNGYNSFINHYASLVSGKVDAFVIGSELIGLTSVNDGLNQFPAVDALVNLAASVKSTLGQQVTVTYAADWSEYHHTNGGWYNLDPLWASPHIDVVGIDAYFPLTNEPQDTVTKQKIIDGWTSGEGYDFVYADAARTVQENVQPEYAWKNLDWWWKNTHTNPDSQQTGWVPQSKPIWFTEYGFPSVDGASNQPNVFYDPSSIESFFPRGSRGTVDIGAQRLALEATEDMWKNSAMVQRLFVWTWDARPFPFWPDLLSVWSDGELWARGHWVNGKLGISNLAAVVAALCKRAGLSASEFDSTALTDIVHGYMMDDQLTVLEALRRLQNTYFFDAVERDGVLTFVKRGKGDDVVLLGDEVIKQVSDSKANIELLRTAEGELPAKVDVTYYNRSFNYQVGDQHSSRQAVYSDQVLTVNLPVVLTDQEAKKVADVTLYNTWIGRNQFSFEVPYRYLHIEPTDIITLTHDAVTYTVRVDRVEMSNEGLMRITGTADDVSAYNFAYVSADITATESQASVIGDSKSIYLDLPALPGEEANELALYTAVRGEESGWKGAAIYRSNDAGVSYSYVASTDADATVGISTYSLQNVDFPQRMDKSGFVEVLLESGELESVNGLALLNGANAALLGNEIIQFQTAEFLGNNKYRLSNLLRGRLGTEWAVNGHAVKESFIVLDSSVLKLPMSYPLLGVERGYKVVSIGDTLANTSNENVIFQGQSLKPFSPVHVRGERNELGDVSISWIRRARVNGDWKDLVDVPMNEAVEQYDLEILNAGEVVRSVSLSSAEYIYSASQQIDDFGMAQSELEVRISQLSEVVGRGMAAMETV